MTSTLSLFLLSVYLSLFVRVLAVCNNQYACVRTNYMYTVNVNHESLH